MGTAFAVVVVAASGAKTGAGHAAACSMPSVGRLQDWLAGYAYGEIYSGSVSGQLKGCAA